MTSLSDVKQAEIIEASSSTARYLDDLLNIDNPYIEGMVNRIYPPELQLNKANTPDTEVPFLNLHLSISNGFVWNSDTSAPLPPRPLVTSAPSPLGPTTTSAPVWNKSLVRSAPYS